MHSHLIVSLASLLLATGLGAQGLTCVLDSAEHAAPDGVAVDLFGESVDVDGDWLVVGASHDDDNGTDSGSAYVYERVGGTWTYHSKLKPADGSAFDHFGRAVAISGDVIAIGAPDDDVNWNANGSAYVFREVAGVWTQEAKLVAADQFENDRFGAAIAADGDTLLIGAPDEFFTAGSAYVFTWNGASWSQQQKLISFPLTGAARLARSVALSGDRAVLGAPFADDGTTLTGAAFVFERNAGVWTQTQRLLGSDAQANDRFGHSVGLAPGVIAVGAHEHDAAGLDAGACYAYRRVGGTWVESEKLIASDALAGDRFGAAIAASGQLIVVGAPGRDAGPALDAGGAYAFLSDGALWPERLGFQASAPATGDAFGSAVASTLDHIALGAPSGDGLVANSGLVATRRISGAWDEYGSGLAGTGGFAPQLSAVVPCPAIGDIPSFEITNGIGGGLGLLLLASERISIPLYGGTLLVGPPLYGQLPHVLGGAPGVAGAGTFTWLLPPTTAGLFGLAAHAQAGYLDAGAVLSVSLSNGLRLTIP